MITEDYVSFEVAKLLKEKGFDGMVHAWYSPFDKNNVDFDLGEIPKAMTKAPTLQIALKWLREVYNIDIQVFRHIRGNKITFYGRIEQNTHLEHIDKCNLYKSYEEAVEDALKYCLTNLIK